MVIKRRVVRRVVKRKRPSVLSEANEANAVKEVNEAPIEEAVPTATVADEDETLQDDLQNELSSLLSGFSTNTKQLFEKQKKIASGELKGKLDISSPLQAEATDVDPTEDTPLQEHPVENDKKRQKIIKPQNTKTKAAKGKEIAVSAKKDPTPKKPAKKGPPKKGGRPHKGGSGGNALFAPDDDSD